MPNIRLINQYNNREAITSNDMITKMIKIRSLNYQIYAST